MLSTFYYMRTLSFESWQAGHVVTVNVFSGKRKELLTIKYIGKDNVRYDKRNYSAYHIRFTFTGNETVIGEQQQENEAKKLPTIWTPGLLPTAGVFLSNSKEN